MASCKFEGGKYHSKTEAKAHLRHDDIGIENRKIASKGNPNIDISKSHLNRSLCGLTYKEACEKYDKRISELDATTNTNKRKDRVTLQNIEIPVPKGLDRKCYNQWFIKVAEMLCCTYGFENFIDGQIHYDEEHEYIDAETGELRMSRVHAHFSIVPEIDGVLNCKKMSSRKNMRELNNGIDNMTKALFGCSFLTGTKQKSRKTVDELKHESNLLALEQRIENCEQREQAVAEAEKRILKADEDIMVRTLTLEEMEAHLGEYERLGIDYYNRARNLFHSLEREEEAFRVNKSSGYNLALERIGELHTKLDESLLSQPQKSKQKARSR